MIQYYLKNPKIHLKQYLLNYYIVYLIIFTNYDPFFYNFEIFQNILKKEKSINYRLLETFDSFC